MDAARCLGERLAQIGQMVEEEEEGGTATAGGEGGGGGESPMARER